MKFPISIPPARVGQPFGANPEFYKPLGIAAHDGQDFPTPIGTPVVAPHDGFIVGSNSNDASYGLYLVLYYEEDGKGWEWIFGHFSQVNFPSFLENVLLKDHPVKAGDVIGLSGNTGNSTGPHLHVGLRFRDPTTHQIINHDNGFFGCVDPMPYLEEKETMSNSFFVFDPATNTFSIAEPKTNPDALISDALNTGLSIPFKPGVPETAPATERIDFDALKATARVLQ